MGGPRMRVPRTVPEQAHMAMLPMIAVLGVLLAGCMLSMRSMTRTRGLPGHLPTAATARARREDVKRTVMPEGTTVLTAQPLTLHDKGQHVTAAVASDPQRTRVVHAADGQVWPRIAVNLLDALWLAGVSGLA